ncbi:MAG: glycosyltransferase family 1 protein [Oscillochloris sp.]|nr:glycosyltransferase family 1 protein [Oscillochloris sp.]
MTIQKRIAMVSEHAGPIALLGGVDAGGQNVHLDELSRNLGSLGYAVDIFTRRDDPKLPEVVDWAPGVRVIHVNAGPVQTIPKDDIWPHMAEFTGGMLTFMLRSGARYDLLHGHFWMSGWAVARLRQRLQLPAVQIFHATGITKRHHQGAADTSPPERIAVERRIVNEVDCMIAQCPAEQHELVIDYGADPGRVMIIPSAVNTRRFRPIDRAAARRAIGLPLDDIPTIVYVGRMLPRKDVRNLLYAAAELIHARAMPVRLLLVGGHVSGDPNAGEVGVLQALAAELRISEHTIFFGQRQPDQLYRYYCAADVAVSTPWYESYGLTPLEAMACGRPIIVSAVGGLTFTVQHGQTGLHVPPQAPQHLAAALHDLLSRPDRGAEMGRKARRRVEREFTWATTAHRTAALYESLLNGQTQAVATAEQARSVGERAPWMGD